MKQPIESDFDVRNHDCRCGRLSNPPTANTRLCFLSNPPTANTRLCF